MIGQLVNGEGRAAAVEIARAHGRIFTSGILTHEDDVPYPAASKSRDEQPSIQRLVRRSSTIRGATEQRTGCHK